MNILKKLFNQQKWSKPPEIDYEKRKADMKHMREVLGMTDKQIGDAMDPPITRERVRQILGNKGREFRKAWTRNLIASGKILFNHHSELQNAPGIKKEWMKDWGKHRHTALGGSVRVGQVFEEEASVILAQNGINNKLMPNRSKYDIETEDGIRVEVVLSRTDASKSESQTRSVYPTFAVAVRRKHDWDFLLAFVPDQNEESGYTYYVFPSYVFEGLATVDARIRVPHPPTSRKPSKWHRFHKNIDLIKEFRNG